MKLFKVKFKKNQTKNDAQQAFKRYSYYQTQLDSNRQNIVTKKSEERSRQAKQVSRWRIKLLNLPSYIAVFLITLSIGFSLTINPSPQIIIAQLVEQSSATRSSQEYQERISAMMKSSILNLSKPSFNSSELERRIVRDFPEIDQAIVSLPILDRRPVVWLKPNQPALVLSTNTSGSWVVGKNGRAIISVADVESRLISGLPRVIDQSGIIVESAKNILSKDQVKFILEIDHQFHQKQISIDKFELPTIANQLEVYPSGKSFFIKFNLLNDPTTQFGAYQVIANDKTFRISQYIDVRIEGRGYYK